MRQQLVVKSLVESVMSPKIIKDPRLVGSVYRVFHEEFGPVIPDLDLVSMVTHLDTYQISIQSAQISITNDEAMGILMVPPIAKYNQWVYEPEDPTWLELQQWIRQQLE
jgi:anionic cell wall polymer biosynthesis LytR-Cps2A-Psr (LCP) family protein